MPGLDVAVIITTMDNLALLEQQVDILKDDPLVTRILVVDQESRDGAREWLRRYADLVHVQETPADPVPVLTCPGEKPVIALLRVNNGAGPGRNAGLDAAGRFDYVLMLDGGMRPLRPGVGIMVDYLEKHPDVDVLGLAWHDLETDVNKAWRRWPWKEIPEGRCYRYSALSLTNYCLCNWKAWDGFRFCEEGPFAEAGWGADDDEMAHQWTEGGIVTHAISDVAAYRRGSGSFRRLFQETGVWPNQYGSTYEKRVVLLRQRWAHYHWGEPEPERIVRIRADGVEATAKKIKTVHDQMRVDRLDPPWSHEWVPYRIIVECGAGDVEFLEWAEPRRLRQHHGDRIIVDGEIVKRGPENEDTWTGDFILEVKGEQSDTINDGAKTL